MDVNVTHTGARRLRAAIVVAAVIGVGLLGGCSQSAEQATPSATATVTRSPVAVPSDWPETMPMPTGLTPIGFSNLGGQKSGGIGYVGRFEGPGDVAQVSAELESAFTAAGFQTRVTPDDPEGTQKWLKPDQLAELKITGDGGLVQVQETILVTSLAQN